MWGRIPGWVAQDDVTDDLIETFTQLAFGTSFLIDFLHKVIWLRKFKSASTAFFSDIGEFATARSAQNPIVGSVAASCYSNLPKAVLRRQLYSHKDSWYLSPHSLATRLY